MAKIVFLYFFCINLLYAAFSAPMTKFDSVIHDELHRIHHDFTIPSEMNNSVEFWFNIYTQYDNRYIIVHNSETYKIYEVIDTSTISKNKLNKFIEKRIVYVKNKYKVKVRTQTGQRNFIYDGLLRLKPYYKTIYFIALNFDLPTELMALPFLESSFNPKAESKAGAVGAWQIMPPTGRYYFSVTKERDDRKNILLSTIAAMWLLKSSYKSLKSWPFVITSYNSGFYHITRAKKKFKNRNLSFKQFIENYDHPNIGFASKNYYSEFLALVHTLAYKELFFPEINFSDQDQDLLKSRIHPHFKFFVNKCDTILKKPENIMLNSHLKYLANKTPKRQILIFKQNPNPKYFEEIPWGVIFKKQPKNWLYKLKDYNCSTTYVE
jgi:membrane-bound lytic murein transglycosylase D